MKLTDFKCFGFPGGERHCDLTGLNDFEFPHILTAHLRSSDDVMDLLLVTDVLRQIGRMPDELELPYVPYARQDRRTTPGSPFSLKVFANLINGLGYQKVWIYEPHSTVTQALIENCEVEPFDEAAIQFISDIGVLPKETSITPVMEADNSILLAPDAGAVNRVSRIQQATGIPMAVVLKKRNPQTGWLEIKQVFGDLKGKDVIVLDDICDGGATFIQLAKYVRDHIDPSGTTRLHLFVAHGIFSKGVDCLLEWYQTIGTTDSFYVGEDASYDTSQKVLVYSSLD